MLSVMISISMVLIFLLILIQVFLTSFNLSEDQQAYSLESGFESLKSSQYMSSSFFMLAVLFVLFDIELVILIPGIFFIQFLSVYFVVSFFNLIILMLITLMLEWAWCGLKWQT